MAVKISEMFAPLLVRLFPFLEPFLPRFFSLSLRRRLRRWKESGLILGYKTRTKRLGKLHYRFSVDLDLTREQTNVILRRAVMQAVRAVSENGEEVKKWVKRRRVM